MSKYNILIVEDEPAMLSGLKDNLEFEGYNVDTAIEGDSGLNKILNNDYSLVLLDVMLPNLSGFDICKKVRNHLILVGKNKDEMVLFCLDFSFWLCEPN